MPDVNTPTPAERAALTDHMARIIEAHYAPLLAKARAAEGLAEALRKCNTCRASMNSAVVEVMDSALGQYRAATAPKTEQPR